MELNLSNPQGYLITELKDGNEFSFVTAQGIKYIVYFAEADGYAPFASFAQDLKMLGFGPVAETRPPGKLPKDDQAINTIFEILYYYIAKYPNRVLVYLCSDESVWHPGPEHKNPRYAQWRRNTFSRWFEEWQESGAIPAEKIDHDLHGQLYCSCVFRSGNPYEKEVRQVIKEVVLEKLPD